jgi:Acetyltransferase (GNAT) domain
MPQSTPHSPTLRVDARKSLGPAEMAGWTAFLAAAAKQHPRQDPRFASVEQADGRDTLFLTGYDAGGKVVAIGLLTMLRHPFWPGAHQEAQCLSGPVCDDAATLVAFLQSVASLPALARVGRLKVTPFWTGPEAELLAPLLSKAGWSIREAEPFRSTGWVDTTLPVEEVFARFSKSARREVRRAERQGITLHRVVDREGAKVFLDSLNRLRKERRLGPISAPGFLAAFDAVYGAGEDGVIFSACHDDSFVAGLQLYRGAHVAHGRQFTTEPARLRQLGNLRIAPFLWLEGLKWAKSKGCAALDVEGWREGVADDDPKYNIYKYKSEFAPVPVRRLAEHSLTLNRSVDVTGNLKGDLRRLVRGIFRRLK